MATYSVSLPRNSHGQRTLTGYSLWGKTVRHDLTFSMLKKTTTKQIKPGFVNLRPFDLSRSLETKNSTVYSEGQFLELSPSITQGCITTEPVERTSS